MQHWIKLPQKFKSSGKKDFWSKLKIWYTSINESFLHKFSNDQKGRDSNEVKRLRDPNLKRFVRLNCFHKLCSITNYYYQTFYKQSILYITFKKLSL